MRASLRASMSLMIAAILLLSISPLTLSQSASNQPPWGFNSSRFRIPFVVANPADKDLANATVLFYLNFPWGEVVSATNELEIQDSAGLYVDSTVLCQTVQEGFVVGACVLMSTDMTGSSATFYAYYGNPVASQRAGKVVPSGMAAAGAAVFSGLDLNYTFLSTYGLNFSSYLSLAGTPDKALRISTPTHMVKLYLPGTSWALPSPTRQFLSQPRRRTTRVCSS